MKTNQPDPGIALVQVLLVVVVLGLAIAVAYLFLEPEKQALTEQLRSLAPALVSDKRPEVSEPPLNDQPPATAGVQPPVAVTVPPTSSFAQPSLARDPIGTGAEAGSGSQLPALDASDARFRQALLELSDASLLEQWLITEELIRKLVVTIDNMAEGRLVRKHSLLKPMNDKFRASVQGEQLWLDGYNFSRYQPYVQLIESIDIQRWSALYQRYYPLLQQAYAELGYPRKAFHERVLLALEQLLASPVIPRALALSQPSVMYTFADPELEQLPAVHKQLLRIGPALSSRLLTRLTLLRAELIKLAPASL